MCYHMPPCIECDISMFQALCAAIAMHVRKLFAV